MSFVTMLYSNLLRYKKIGDGTVFVYTMGKVGSSAIYEGLSEAYQLHNFDGEIPAKYFSSRFTPYVRRYLFETLRWKLFHKKAYKRFEKAMRLGHKVKVISVVRDPVARNISAFFQNLDASQIYSKEGLQHDFFALTNHMLPLEWFDLEFKRHLGVSVYDYKFDVDSGYSIIEQDNCEIMIVQLEKLNANADVIRRFIDDDKFDFAVSDVQGNVSSVKWYKEYVQFLKENAVFPRAYLDLMYDSKYMRHFYSQSDIANLRAKWCKFG